MVSELFTKYQFGTMLITDDKVTNRALCSADYTRPQQLEQPRRMDGTRL